MRTSAYASFSFGKITPSFFQFVCSTSFKARLLFSINQFCKNHPWLLQDFNHFVSREENKIHLRHGIRGLKQATTTSATRNASRQNCLMSKTIAVHVRCKSFYISLPTCITSNTRDSVSSNCGLKIC